ncbi:MAG: LytTR family DNA-binding domain-containing protein [Lachnospiraceae bacterium]|nr:LytTR family DNA-binding domain-containing protein [Lachnospiraceae bacterium]
MKVKLNLSSEYRDPEAEIRTARITGEVEAAVDFLQNPAQIVTAYAGEKMVVLKPADVYMVRVENEKTVLYTKTRSCLSGKRLYELQKMLGNGFMRISKSAIVNLNYLDHVEAEFGGMMLLTLQNGSQEYVSRHYLPDFKKYLGL